MKKIKLGYEIKTGKQIDISPSHLIVTGRANGVKI